MTAAVWELVGARAKTAVLIWAASVSAAKAEILWAGALLIGWTLLTWGIASLIRWQVWPISAGLLLLSFCGWRMLRQMALDGLYTLSRDEAKK